MTGTVTKITNFGVFVGLENGLEGLLHISELADHKVENPEEIVKVGDEIEVKVLRVDTDERKIGLSRKRVDWAEEDAETEEAAALRPQHSARRSSRAASATARGPLIRVTRDGKLALTNSVAESIARPRRGAIGASSVCRRYFELTTAKILRTASGLTLLAAGASLRDR